MLVFVILLVGCLFVLMNDDRKFWVTEIMHEFEVDPKLEEFDIR